MDVIDSILEYSLFLLLFAMLSLVIAMPIVAVAENCNRTELESCMYKYKDYDYCKRYE